MKKPTIGSRTANTKTQAAAVGFGKSLWGCPGGAPPTSCRCSVYFSPSQ